MTALNLVLQQVGRLHVGLSGLLPLLLYFEAVAGFAEALGCVFKLAAGAEEGKFFEVFVCLCEKMVAPSFACESGGLGGLEMGT